MDTSILDSVAKISKIDMGGVYSSIVDLSKQCTHAWEEANKVNVPGFYSEVNNLVMCGMGGSGLGARIVESVYSDKLRIPFYKVNDYNLPGFVTNNSLVVCSSYSGNTEETLANLEQAKARGAKILVVCAGGKLAQYATDNGIPFYQIDPMYNTSNQPRMAIGYSVIGQLVLLNKASLVDVNKSDIEACVSVMQEVVEKYKVGIPYDQNPAKQVASSLYDKIVLFVSSEHLVGASHTVNNQFNENTKNLTFDFTIPELNHHLMEGLKHPNSNIKNVSVYFFNSNIYSDQIKKRFDLTMDIVNQNKLTKFDYVATSRNRLSQSFEIIQFGSFVNFYLSMLYKQDPSPIPWVDYFKEGMKR